MPGLLLVLGTALYAAAAGEGQLSLVSVLGSLFPVVTVGLGVAVVGERLTRTQAVGVASALAGIVLIAGLEQSPPRVGDPPPGWARSTPGPLAGRAPRTDTAPIGFIPPPRRAA